MRNKSEPKKSGTVFHILVKDLCGIWPNSGAVDYPTEEIAREIVAQIIKNRKEGQKKAPLFRNTPLPILEPNKDIKIRRVIFEEINI